MIDAARGPRLHPRLEMDAAIYFQRVAAFSILPLVRVDATSVTVTREFSLPFSWSFSP